MALSVEKQLKNQPLSERTFQSLMAQNWVFSENLFSKDTESFILHPNLLIPLLLLQY
jgi:hypothetical protein